VIPLQESEREELNTISSNKSKRLPNIDYRHKKQRRRREESFGIQLQVRSAHKKRLEISITTAFNQALVHLLGI